MFPQEQPWVYARYALGSLFTLYLPGFALTEALFPGKEDLNHVERLAFSVGLSLALVALDGLALNYTPWGITIASVFVSLSLLTVGLAAIAFARRFSSSEIGEHRENR